MKLRLTAVVICIAMVAAFAGSAFAAQSSVTVYPLAFAAGAVSGQFETKVSQNATLAIEGTYWKPPFDDDFDDVTALGVAVGSRFYLRGTAHEGVYVGGYLAYGRLVGEHLGSPASASVLGGALSAGYKGVFAGGFLLDLGVSVGAPFATTITGDGFTESHAGGMLGTSVGIGIGYAW